MKKNNEAERFAEEILSSLNMIQPADVDDFLFTRVQNRINCRQQARPAQMTVLYRLSMTLLLFFILNGATYYFLKRADTRTGDRTVSGLTAFAGEFKMTQNTYNY